MGRKYIGSVQSTPIFSEKREVISMQNCSSAAITHPQTHEHFGSVIRASSTRIICNANILICSVSKFSPNFQFLLGKSMPKLSLSLFFFFIRTSNFGTEAERSYTLYHLITLMMWKLFRTVINKNF